MAFHQLVGENLAKPHGWFGRLVGLFMNIRNKTLNKWTLDLLSIKSNDYVLEIGFGTGATIKIISGLTYKGLTAGIDYSLTMFDRASRVNARAISKGQVELTTGDAKALPYQDEFFDKVCSIHCIYFWLEPEQTLKEIRRVLKNEGILAIAIDSKEELLKVKRTENFILYTAGELTELLTKSGYKKVRIEAHPNKSGLCAIGVK